MLCRALGQCQAPEAAKERGSSCRFLPAEVASLKEAQSVPGAVDFRQLATLVDQAREGELQAADGEAMLPRAVPAHAVQEVWLQAALLEAQESFR